MKNKMISNKGVFLGQKTTPKDGLRKAIFSGTDIWDVLLVTLGGGNSNIYLKKITPNPGEMIQFDEHILQRG